MPLLLSFATVPAYLNLIGEVRYGVLAVVWVILGYFGVFDLGLSRATANQIARMRHEALALRERVFWTALSLNAIVGVIGGIILFFVGRFLLKNVLEVGPDLRAEAIAALPWLAVAVPLTTITLVLAGTLEGGERFALVNSLAIIGVATFQLLPLGYAYWVGPNLSGLIMSATLGLLMSTAIAFLVTALALPLRSRPKIDAARVGVLLRYGGWVTVSGLVSPLVSVSDRVVIGSVLGAKAVTLYTIPFALVSRVQILSMSLARAIFPRVSMLDHVNAARVSRESLRALAAVMTFLAVLAAVTVDPFLRVWVGKDIASSSAPVGEILIMGIWVNSLAIVPFALLQARGRPDLPAKFHALELVPYFAALVVGLHFAGIEGAAWAWSARVAADGVLLYWAAERLSGETATADWQRLVRGGMLVGAACVAALTIFDVPALRIAVGGPLIVGSAVWGWRIAPAQARLALRRVRPRTFTRPRSPSS